jgi:uncharacterized protein DUF3857
MPFCRYLFERRLCALFAFLLAGSLSAQQKQPAPPEFLSWLPITDAERQMQAPTVEKDAGAEVLFWRVHVVDELLLSGGDIQRVFYHYIRLKVFNDKGKEQVATVDLDYGEKGSILDVAGRTIKADGTVIELEKKAIFHRDLERVGGRKRRVTSFAVPGVEPGVIVEYRWKESLDSNAIMYQELQFQREYPVRKVTYFVRPLAGQYTAYRASLQSFHCQPTPLTQESDGYQSITVENLPAFREEPFSPSAPNLRAWALLYYQIENAKDPERYWNEIGKKAYQELKDALKSNDALKSAAAQATAGATNDEDKMVALIAFVRKTVRNVFDSGVTAAEREKFYEKLPKERRRTAAEIFESRLGTSYELNVVFGAMAAQAGMEARPVYVSDWSQVVFNPKTMTSRYFINNLDMAVKIGDSWKIYDVSNKLLAPGQLSWREEGGYALLTDPKNPTFIKAPVSNSKASEESKVAHLKLSRDGALEGDVEETYTGHRALDRRIELSDESEERRQEWLRERVQKMFPNAEVTSIAIQNADDPSQPLRFRYHLDAPQYAQSTGKRMFFHILPFERSHASPFAAAERRNAIVFPYGWRETDEVRIQLPEGLVLDNAEVPGSVGFGKTGGYNLSVTVKDHALITTRELTFADGGLLMFDTSGYAPLQKIFGEIQRRDGHTLALKEQ